VISRPAVVEDLL